MPCAHPERAAACIGQIVVCRIGIGRRGPMTAVLQQVTTCLSSTLRSEFIGLLRKFEVLHKSQFNARLCCTPVILKLKFQDAAI